MKWLIVTCDASAHIRPVQEWLFRKYAPKAELQYIDVGNEPVATWGRNVLKKIKVPDYFVIFGLDDYLPTAPINMDRMRGAAHLMKDYDLDRFELGYGAYNKKPFMKSDEEPFIDHDGVWLEYGQKTPYSVSCQFSIWKLSALTHILSECSTPWNFETGHQCVAGCFPKGGEAFRWIEESALSGKKWMGKINVNGMSSSDVRELVRLKLLDVSLLINNSDGGYQTSDLDYPEHQ